MKIALLYCRVSSERQVKEGNGLSSQQIRCKNYCKNKGYPIEKIFDDEGVSGGLFERPAMKSLIEHLDKNPHKEYVIVFDDLSRLARNLEVHLKLKAELEGRGAKLESPNFNFEDTPEGTFVENIMASTAQLAREQNRRQVIQKMKARLESGYWPFCYPPALKNEIKTGRGRILTPVEPIASIFKEAIERYSNDLLNTLEEVQLFIQTKYQEHDIDRKISIEGARNILKEELYAGYIKYEPWGVPFQKAKHDGFISLETYNKVQDKLLGKSKPRLRKDYNLDFPLRGFVVCSCCGQTMTASWNKGRGGRYPNYWCKNKVCEKRYKTVSKSKLEKEFENLLLQSKPKTYILDIARDIFLDAWKAREANYNKFIDQKNKEKQDIEEQIKNYVTLIGRAMNNDIVSEYESMISELKIKLRTADQEQISSSYTEKEFGTALTEVLNTLNKPIETWRRDNIEDKRTILYMYFDKKLEYKLNEGFGTATLAYPVSLMKDMESSKINLVEMSGIEPESK